MDYKGRKPNRWKNYDYSQNGMYFVTVCTADREEIFGEIINGKMILNGYGKIAEQQLDWLVKQYPYATIDCRKIMPNHVHLIIEINSAQINAGTGRDLSLPGNKIKIKSLSELIGAFKTTSSKLIHEYDSNSFAWQRSFHDRIIRNDAELNRIREYIASNPATWHRDRNNQENIFN